MKFVFIFAALSLVLASAASAGFNCTTIGHITTCTDDGGNSINCTKIGHITTCN